MKNKILKTFGVSALALCGMFAFSGCANTDEMKTNIKNLENKIAVLEQDNSTLLNRDLIVSADIEEMEDIIATLKQQILALEQSNTVLTQQNVTFVQNLNTIKNSIEDLEDEIELLEQKDIVLGGTDTDTQQNIELLKEQVETLSQQLEELLEESETPQEPATPEFTINSNKEAYNYLVQAMNKMFYNEDGTFRNATQTGKYKNTGDEEWTEVSNNTLSLKGTLYNGVTYYYYNNNSPISNWDYLIYEEDGKVYQLTVLYELDGETEEPHLFIKKELLEYESISDYMPLSLDTSNWEIKSYTKLENGNYEIVYEETLANTQNFVTTFTRFVNTVIINADGLPISEMQRSYESTYDHTTQTQTEYVKEDTEYLFELEYTDISSDKILQLFAIAKNTELTTNP